MTPGDLNIDLTRKYLKIARVVDFSTTYQMPSAVCRSDVCFLSEGGPKDPRPESNLSEPARNRIRQLLCELWRALCSVSLLVIIGYVSCRTVFGQLDSFESNILNVPLFGPSRADRLPAAVSRFVRAVPLCSAPYMSVIDESFAGQLNSCAVSK